MNLMLLVTVAVVVVVLLLQVDSAAPNVSFSLSPPGLIATNPPTIKGVPPVLVVTTITMVVAAAAAVVMVTPMIILTHRGTGSPEVTMMVMPV